MNEKQKKPTPNSLDQTDESQKAADITRKGEELAKRTSERQKGQAEMPEPKAPDGKSQERYAG